MTQKRKLVLHQVPPSLNVWQRMHWSERRRLKEEWEWEIFALCNGMPKGNSHIIIEADIYFDTVRRRDITNFEATVWKLTNDALVNAKVVPDDTHEYITNGVVQLHIDNEPRTELTIMLVK